MSKNSNDAIKSLAEGLIESGIKTGLNKRELDSLGIIIEEPIITPAKIKNIRKKTKLSQAVFAMLLNVSRSIIRQWEQGTRTPTGSTKTLLELLNRDPHILDYKIQSKLA